MAKCYGLGGMCLRIERIWFRWCICANLHSPGIEQCEPLALPVEARPRLLEYHKMVNCCMDTLTLQLSESPRAEVVWAEQT
jgi:hypothetical protein